MSVVIDRRTALAWAVASSLAGFAGSAMAQASESPEVLIQRVAAELIEAVKAAAVLLLPLAAIALPEQAESP